MLQIGHDIAIPDDEIELTAVRAPGAGGQNVNKVATAIHLRFDARASRALPDEVRELLLSGRDRRVSQDGVVIIKAKRFRSQERNRADALARLARLIENAARPRTRRVPTKLPRRARERRLTEKKRRGHLKETRNKIPDD